MYFQVLSSGFNRDEELNRVRELLKIIKPNIDSLVKWEKQHVDELNVGEIINKEEYNKDYLELQRIINDIIGE